MRCYDNLKLRNGSEKYTYNFFYVWEAVKYGILNLEICYVFLLP
jgi:hypothetical protein